MKFQKYICLAMIIVGALGLLYSFCYLSGSMSELGQTIDYGSANKNSFFTAAKGKYDATLFTQIQGFNNMLMIFGIVMVLLAVLLYVTASNKRRNYYVSNYVAIGLCSVGNIGMSLVSIIMNAIWRGRFLNVDFEAWYKHYEDMQTVLGDDFTGWHYSESTAWFDVGFAVYAIIIVASIVLLLNLVWKILLMKGEKKLLAGNQLAGGEAV